MLSVMLVLLSVHRQTHRYNDSMRTWFCHSITQCIQCSDGASCGWLEATRLQLILKYHKQTNLTAYGLAVHENLNSVLTAVHKSSSLKCKSRPNMYRGSISKIEMLKFWSTYIQENPNIIVMSPLYTHHVPLKISTPMRICSPSNTTFLWPSQVFQNGILIFSADFGVPNMHARKHVHARTHTQLDSDHAMPQLY